MIYKGGETSWLTAETDSSESASQHDHSFTDSDSSEPDIWCQTEFKGQNQSLKETGDKVPASRPVKSKL